MMPKSSPVFALLFALVLAAPASAQRNRDRERDYDQDRGPRETENVDRVKALA